MATRDVVLATVALVMLAGCGGFFGDDITQTPTPDVTVTPVETTTSFETTERPETTTRPRSTTSPSTTTRRTQTTTTKTTTTIRTVTQTTQPPTTDGVVVLPDVADVKIQSFVLKDIASDTGKIRSVDGNIHIVAEWTSLRRPPVIVVSIRVAGEWVTIRKHFTSTITGQVTLDVDKSLDNTDRWDKLYVPDDGTQTTYEISVAVMVIVPTDSGGERVASDTAVADVTVVNQEASAGSSGSGNSSAS